MTQNRQTTKVASTLLLVLCALTYTQGQECSESNLCDGGYCCSQYGFCGDTSEHCGDGCLSQCDGQGSTDDQQCSADTPCDGGMCCSQYGFCGVTSEFCGDGCQSQCDGQVSTPIYTQCVKEGDIAVTFDDGPATTSTRTILKQLKQKGVVATFFVTGEMVEKNPQVLVEIDEMGHEIGCHSVTHSDLTTLGDKDLDYEFKGCIDAVEAAIGKTVKMMRPPFLATNAAVADKAEKYNQAIISINHDSKDYTHKGNPKAIAKAYNGLDKDFAGKGYGVITLLHDIHDTTAMATGKVLKRLKKQNWNFVTVSECLGEDLSQNS